MNKIASNSPGGQVESQSASFPASAMAKLAMIGGVAVGIRFAIETEEGRAETDWDSVQELLKRIEAAADELSAQVRGGHGRHHYIESPDAAQ